MKDMASIIEALKESRIGRLRHNRDTAPKLLPLITSFASGRVESPASILRQPRSAPPFANKTVSFADAAASSEEGEEEAKEPSYEEQLAEWEKSRADEEGRRIALGARLHRQVSLRQAERRLKFHAQRKAETSLGVAESSWVNVSAVSGNTTAVSAVSVAEEALALDYSLPQYSPPRREIASSGGAVESEPAAAAIPEVASDTQNKTSGAQSSFIHDQSLAFTDDLDLSSAQLESAMGGDLTFDSLVKTPPDLLSPPSNNNSWISKLSASPFANDIRRRKRSEGESEEASVGGVIRGNLPLDDSTASIEDAPVQPEAAAGEMEEKVEKAEESAKDVEFSFAASSLAWTEDSRLSDAGQTRAAVVPSPGIATPKLLPPPTPSAAESPSPAPSQPTTSGEAQDEGWARVQALLQLARKAETKLEAENKALKDGIKFVVKVAINQVTHNTWIERGNTLIDLMKGLGVKGVGGRPIRLDVSKLHHIHFVYGRIASQILEKVRSEEGENETAMLWLMAGVAGKVGSLFPDFDDLFSASLVDAFPALLPTYRARASAEGKDAEERSRRLHADELVSGLWGAWAVLRRREARLWRLLAALARLPPRPEETPTLLCGLLREAAHVLARPAPRGYGLQFAKLVGALRSQLIPPLLQSPNVKATIHKFMMLTEGTGRRGMVQYPESEAAVKVKRYFQM